MDAPFANRLPPELLIAIATFADQSTIIRLATVCRYLRVALIGTPTLWTSVDCQSAYRTWILLQRSKSNPIDVTIDSDRYVPEAIYLVASHTRRMRSIEMDLYPSHFGDVRPLLNGSAPILEAMRVRRRVDPPPLARRRSSPLPPYSSFFQSKFHALRALYLEGYPLDLTQSAPMITNGLTTLVLDSRQSYSRRGLLECLEHCESLVHLKIDLPNLRGTVPASHIIPLPNLRELQSGRSPLSVLRHLSFPPSADLIIGPCARQCFNGHPFTTVWEQRGLLQMLESRPIEGIQITFTGPDCAVALTGPHLVFVEHAKANPSRHTSFHSDCLDSLQSLPTTATGFLRLAQPLQRLFTETLRPQSCTRLLRQMPELAHIILDESVALPFVRALEPVNGQVPCPKLQVLLVIRREGHEVHLRNGLVALSNLRNGHGCPLECNMGSSGLSSWRPYTHLERVA